MRQLTLVRADARKNEWFARNGVAVHAVSRTPLNMALGRTKIMSNVAHILEDIEYLVPLISYLGSNPFWWARSAPSLARELSLDEGRVQQIFERHPMIFRKSRYIEESKAYCYALQMRYAQRRDGETEHPPQVSAFPVLSESQVIALIEFLVKVSTLETGVRSATRSAYVAVAAAILAALAAIAAALLKH